MKTQLENAFPCCKTGKCLETTKVLQFEVFDCEIEKRCFIKKSAEELAHFHIENPHEKSIHFLAIDNGVYPDDVQKKCDFAVFDEQTFCFIELKHSKPRKRKERRKRAIQQLRATIERFQQQCDFEDYNLEAYASVGNLGLVFKSRLASHSSAFDEFDGELNTALFEGNSKRFA